MAESKNILSVPELLKSLDQMNEDFTYDISKAKSPKRLRELKRSQQFFSSIRHHLTKGGSNA